MEKKEAEKSIFYSAAALLGSWFAYALVFEELLFGFIFSCFIAFLAFSALNYLPVHQKKEKTKEFEKFLPFALLQAGIELNLGLSFEETIQSISRNNYGVLSEAFKKILMEVRNGASMQEALMDLGRNFDSLLVKRALSRLIAVYWHGNRKREADSLKRLGEEILSRQKIEAKEFSGKMVMASLLFIAVSAIIPALFQAFVVVGSMIMDLGLSPLHALLVPVLVFPVIDLAVLLAIKSRTPYFLRGA